LLDARDLLLKKIHSIVAVLGLAVAAGAAWWWQNKGVAGDAATAAAPAAGAAQGPGAGGAARPPGGGPGGAGGAGGPPGARPGGPGGPVAVEVAAAQATTISDDVQAVGSVNARQGVVLRPEVSGRIAQLGFRDGQTVRRGQLILQLDDTLQRAQLQQAEAQASIARTNLQRSRELLAQNFVSQSAVDQNAAALQVAEAQVALAQAQLARMRIVAPFDGVVGIRSVDVGEYVKDGADIVALEDRSGLSADFRLPERYLDRVRVGLPVEVTVDALPGRSFRARVEALDAQVDANGRALLVRTRLEELAPALKSGMFARGKVVFSVRQNAVTVPEEALVPVGGRQFLFKIADGPEGRKVAQRLEARIGVRQPGRVEILQGLAPGDQVVTAGHTRLRGESSPVRIVDLSRPPGPPGGGAAGAGAGPRPAAPGAVPGGAPGGASGGAPGGAVGAASAPRP
jgi:membrane fusion protein (multidrug efflux system)